MKTTLIPLLLTGLIACGDKDDSAADSGHDHGTHSDTDADTDSDTDSETDTDTDSETDTDADVSWSEMNRDQRHAFMEEAVMPALSATMQGHDSDLYGGETGFQCTTCHGDAFWEAGVDYAMPNPANADKTAIGDGAPGVIDWTSEDPAYVAYRDELMFSVSTQMATLLELEPWSQDNPDGFGCANCHPSAAQ